MENLIQINSISPIRPGAPAGAPVSASPFSQMQPGDTISALVTEASGGGVTLTFPDGSSVHASMQAGQALQARDMLILQLSSDHGAAPSLRLLEVNNQPVTAQIPVLDMNLMEMNIPASRTNLAAAALLQRLGLPVDAESLSRFGELRASYPSLPPEQAAVFAGSKIPINAQNVSAFSQFVSSPAQAEDVASALEQALSRTDAQTSPGGAFAAPEAPAPLVPPSAQGGHPSSPVSASASSSTGAQPVSEQASPANTTAGDASPVQDLPQSAPQAAASASSAAPGSPVPADPAKAAFTPPALNFDGGGHTVADALRSIFPRLLPEESDSLGKALQKAVPSLAPRIAALSEAAASAHTQGAKEAAQLGAQFVRQMSFGNEMASLYYTQIPFDYKENRSNAELYVLKRNRGDNGIDPSNATIALCLDTRNMGRVESLVQVRSQDLSFNFRVETKQIKDIVQEELGLLSKFEFPSQYHFKGASVAVMDSPITPVSAAKLMRDTFGMPESGGIDITI